MTEFVYLDVGFGISTTRAFARAVFLSVCGAGRVKRNRPLHIVVERGVAVFCFFVIATRSLAMFF